MPFEWFDLLFSNFINLFGAIHSWRSQACETVSSNLCLILKFSCLFREVLFIFSIFEILFNLFVIYSQIDSFSKDLSFLLKFCNPFRIVRSLFSNSTIFFDWLAPFSISFVRFKALFQISFERFVPYIETNSFLRNALISFERFAP